MENEEKWLTKLGHFKTQGWICDFYICMKYEDSFIWILIEIE